MAGDRQTSPLFGSLFAVVSTCRRRLTLTPKFSQLALRLVKLSLQIFAAARGIVGAARGFLQLALQLGRQGKKLDFVPIAHLAAVESDFDVQLGYGIAAMLVRLDG